MVAKRGALKSWQRRRDSLLRTRTRVPANLRADRTGLDQCVRRLQHFARAEHRALALQRVHPLPDSVNLSGGRYERYRCSISFARVLLQRNDRRDV